MKKKYNLITVIMVLLIGVSITAGISYFVYADALSSALVTYSRENSEVVNVEGALNELYTKSSVGDATAANILSGKTALVGGATVTGTMTNKGAVTLTSAQTGTITINGYVTTINASAVYTAGYNAKTCPSCGCSGSYLLDGSEVCELRKYNSSTGTYVQIYRKAQGEQKYFSM